MALSKQEKTELKNAVAELRDGVKQKNEELEELKNTLPSTQAKIEAANDKLDELEDLKERQDELETKLSRRGVEMESTSGDVSEHRKAFNDWINNRPVDAETYKEYLHPSDTKDLSIGSGANQSDALAPREFVEEIIQDAVDISPVRQVARVLSTDRKRIDIPKLQERPSAAYVAETGTRTNDDDLDFGEDNDDMITIDLPEFFVQIGVTRQMIEDSAFDVEAEVQNLVATELERLQGEKFLQGSGSGEPQGLLTAADFETEEGADAENDITSITAEDVRQLPLRVKQTYRTNGVWGVTREALRHLRTLQDDQGMFLFTPNLNEATPPTIDGYEYVEMEDLVTADTAGDGDIPLVFGDFERAYIVGDRLQMELIRDPYSAKESGKIEYHFRGRSGGELALAEAVKGLEVAGA